MKRQEEQERKAEEREAARLAKQAERDERLREERERNRQEREERAEQRREEREANAEPRRASPRPRSNETKSTSHPAAPTLAAGQESNRSSSPTNPNDVGGLLIAIVLFSGGGFVLKEAGILDQIFAVPQTAPAPKARNMEPPIAMVINREHALEGSVWFRHDPIPDWNRAGMAIPRAVAVPSDYLEKAREGYLRSLESRNPANSIQAAVKEAGWLVESEVSDGNIAVIDSFDAHVSHQGFVFYRGTFVGTLYPAPDATRPFILLNKDEISKSLGSSDSMPPSCNFLGAPLETGADISHTPPTSASIRDVPNRTVPASSNHENGNSVPVRTAPDSSIAKSLTETETRTNAEPTGPESSQRDGTTAAPPGIDTRVRDESNSPTCFQVKYHERSLIDSKEIETTLTYKLISSEGPAYRLKVLEAKTKHESGWTRTYKAAP